MKKFLVFPISLLSILLCLSNFSFCQKSSLTHKNNLRILYIEGGPYQRGYEHGKSLKTEIHKLLDLWKENLERTYKVEAGKFIANFLKKTSFEKSIKQWTPDLWEELKGIADGAEVEFDTIYAFQLIDEIWVAGKDIHEGHCTSIGVEKTKIPAMVAQNMDIPSFYHGFQTLLYSKDPKTGWKALIFTIPGVIGINGLNNRSVAVVVNAVQQLKYSQDGLPVAFVIRGILNKKTYEEAVKFIHAVNHGAPQNYMIGGRENVGSFECSVTEVSTFSPFQGAKFTYHTNHPLTNFSLTEKFLGYIRSKNKTPRTYVHKCPRFEYLQNTFKDNSTNIDVELLKKIFSDRKTIINNRGTYGCTIMVLKDNPELHISPGRPDEEEFLVFKFNR